MSLGYNNKFSDHAQIKKGKKEKKEKFSDVPYAAGRRMMSKLFCRLGLRLRG